MITTIKQELTTHRHYKDSQESNLVGTVGTMYVVCLIKKKCTITINMYVDLQLIQTSKLIDCLGMKNLTLQMSKTCLLIL